MPRLTAADLLSAPSRLTPTCERDRELSLRARRAIAAGEELTIAYVDDAGLLPERRRAALRHGYGFECACERCVAEARTAAGRRL